MTADSPAAGSGSRRIRVALLLEDLAFGGTQRQALELASRLDPSRFDSRMWTLVTRDDFADEARERGLSVERLSGGTVVTPTALWRLHRNIRRFRPDILLLLTVLPNIWGRVIGRLSGVPVLIANSRQSGNPRRQHEKLLKRLATHTVCNANALKEQLINDFGVDGNRITVIHNGVDFERFQPASGPAEADIARAGDSPGASPAQTSEAVPESAGSPEQRILMLGRLVPAKNHDLLIEAFCRVAPRHPSARLSIVGDGARRDELIRLAAEKGAGRIEILPARRDVLPLFHSASIFALSSRSEGFPNVIAEAMASGLPVAATDVDGVPELVAHGETGILSPSGDVEALAASLDTLLGDRETARRMGLAGRKRVEEYFSFAAMAAKHEQLFERLYAEGAC